MHKGVDEMIIDEAQPSSVLALETTTECVIPHITEEKPYFIVLST